jgi:protein CpxP
MKQLIFLFALMIPLMGSAQKSNHKEKLTDEQRATLQAKKMQLALELSEKQTGELAAIFKKNLPQNHQKGNRDEMTSEDRYEMQLKKLDHQIALQNEIKKVLTEDQFLEWKKMKGMKKPRRNPKGNGKKHPGMQQKH